MDSYTTWIPPVAVSLLLHAALIALTTYQFSSTRSGTTREQTITVTLLGQVPPSASKPRIQAVKPVQKTTMPQPAPIVNAVPQEPPTAMATTEQTSPVKQDTDNATETGQPGLTIQPLGKLTRPPAFLRRIEPVYPVAEQRAGSQANVLTEVTIDENGKVREVRIAKSAGKYFDDAVIEALKKSVFVPGYIDKEAVAVKVFVPFRFNLN